MKFKISETIDTSDTQRVLRTLENCLREVSSDATASDDEIVFRGLGPSPVSINPRDIAVLRLHSENGKTVIDGDVTFLASALLQNSSQEDIVRSKLERIFDRVKIELSSQMPASAAPHDQQAAIASAVPVVPEETMTQPAVTVEEPPVLEAAPARESIAPRAAAAPLFSAYHRQTIPEDSGTGRGKRIAAWMTTLVVLLLAGAFLTHYRTRVNDLRLVLTRKIAHLTAPVVATEPETSDIIPNTPTDEHSETAKKEQPSPGVAGPADIRTWLENWAASIRSRDAVAQSSFYANTVNRYMDRHNVSRDAVMKDREATIRMRKGLWTMKIERVVVEYPTESEARVHLVKHFIDEPAESEVLESFVPTQMTLRRVDGRWEITSEFDLPPSAPIINRSR